MKKITFSTTSITSVRSILPIVIVALVAGTLLTTLAWFNIEARWQGLASWWSLGAVTLGGLFLKYKRPYVSRLALTLAVLAGVSLVYLFPELFSPGCDGMPKAFAACPIRCRTQCVEISCNLRTGCVCARRETTCEPYCGGGGGGGGGGAPVITGVLGCALPGSDGWCRGGLALNLSATDPQNGTILVSGDLNGLPFACNNGVPATGPINCSVPLSEGTGTANFTATASSGLNDNDSLSWEQDSIAPAASGSLSGSVGTNGWYVSAVNFSAAGSDAGSGLDSITCTLDGSPSACSASTSANGPHTLAITATDNAGNSASATSSFSIDTQAPTLNSSLSGTAGSNGWYTAATLNASASDPAPSSGAPALEYALDGGAWISLAGSYTVPDGKHTLDVRAVDAAGNIAQATQVSAWVDSVAPAISVDVSGTAGDNGWYTSSAVVNVSASDPAPGSGQASGVSTFEYSLDNGNTWTTYPSNQTLTLTLTDGIQDISFYAKDAAGKSTQVDQNVKVDTLAPQISGSLSGTPGANGWYISNVVLSASASDNTSGISSFTYTLNGGSTTAYTIPITLADGQHMLVLNARDAAGLTDRSTQNVKVDTVAPALTVLSVLPTWNQDTVTLNGTASDSTSGLARVEVSTDNGASWHIAVGTSSWSYAWDTQAEVNGPHIARVRSVDNAAPHIELPDEWNIWDTVTFDAWDHDSGLAGAEIVISDPQDRWPKRTLHFDPGHLPVGLKWDRRFGDGTIAPLGDYEVDARASDNLGNSRHVTAIIHINLAGSLFSAPAAATPLPSPLPSRTPTPTALIPTLTATPQSTNAELTIFGTPGSGPGAIASPLGTPTATSAPVLRPTPTQANLFTLIQSIFSPPPVATETVSSFESDPGPSLFGAAQAAQTDPGGMASNLIFGGAVAASVAAFAAYIEQKRREEEQAEAEAAARRRETARERNMDDGERQAENLHKAIAAVTAQEQKEWKAERYEQISQTDAYKDSDNKTKFMKQELENIEEQEAAYRAEQKRKAEDQAEAARKAAEEAALAAKLPPMPEGLSPEAQMAFLHGGANWIAANASTLQAQYVEDLANRQQTAEANTPGKGPGLAAPAPDDNPPSWWDQGLAWMNDNLVKPTQEAVQKNIVEPAQQAWDNSVKAITQAWNTTVTTVTQVVDDTKKAITQAVEDTKKAASATASAAWMYTTSKTDEILDNVYDYHGPANPPTGVTGQSWLTIPGVSSSSPNYNLDRYRVEQHPTGWQSWNECVTAASLQAMNMVQDILAAKFGITQIPQMDLPTFASAFDASGNLWLLRPPADIPIVGGMLPPPSAVQVLEGHSAWLRDNFGCGYNVELTSGNTPDDLIQNLQNGYPTILHISQDVNLFNPDGSFGDYRALLGGGPHTLSLVGYDATTDSWKLLDPAGAYKSWNTPQLMSYWGRQFIFYPPRFAMTTLIPDTTCTPPLSGATLSVTPTIAPSAVETPPASQAPAPSQTVQPAAAVSQTPTETSTPTVP